MKRIVLLLSIVASILPLNAQMQIVNVSSMPVEICKVRLIPLIESTYQNNEVATLYKRDSLYYISTGTSNRFDDLFEFPLGKSVKAVEETLGQLIQMCQGEVGTQYIVEGKNGRPCAITTARKRETDKTKVKNKPGTEVIFQAQGYVGIVIINKKQFETLLKRFKEATKEE